MASVGVLCCTVANAAPAIELEYSASIPEYVMVPPEPVSRTGRITQILQQRFPMVSQVPGIVTEYGLLSPKSVARFYSQRSYRPAWVTNHGLIPAAEQFVRLLGKADERGLDSQNYHYRQLKDKLTELNHHQSSSVQLWIDMDVLLTDAWLTYAEHLYKGRIDPRSYDKEWLTPRHSQDFVAALQKALVNNTVIATLKKMEPSQREYRGLKKMLAHYQQIEADGGWPVIPAGDKMQRGSQGPRVQLLQERLKATGDFKGVVTPIFTRQVADAVKNFQKRHGLSVDGVVGSGTLKALNVPVSKRIEQIALNIERWRWLPRNLGRRHILVNITDYSMSVVDRGRDVFSSKVIVGRTERPTPVMSAKMSYLVMNPRWNVPKSIAVKDKLPKLKKNPNALKRSKIRVFNRQGKEIDPRSVNWKSLDEDNFNYFLRQDAGPGNALGRIKFMFPNRHAVYLHDTPARSLFRKNRRAYSSGCVRVEKPIELATYLLRGRWNKGRIVATTKSKEADQKQVGLTKKLPVHLVYMTAWLGDDGLPQFRPDIYKRDGQFIQALRKRSSSMKRRISQRLSSQQPLAAR